MFVNIQAKYLLWTNFSNKIADISYRIYFCNICHADPRSNTCYDFDYANLFPTREHKVADLRTYLLIPVTPFINFWL